MNMKKLRIATSLLALIIMMSACTNMAAPAVSSETDDTSTPLVTGAASSEPVSSSETPSKQVEVSDRTIWFSESSETRGVFWLGMTLDDCRKAIESNRLEIRDEYSTDDEYRIVCVGNIALYFNTDMELYCLEFGATFLRSEDEASVDAFTTERGLKRNDTIARAKELYGDQAQTESRGNLYYKLNEGLYLILVGTLLENPESTIDSINYTVSLP
jgi:hypothetical protein